MGNSGLQILDGHGQHQSTFHLAAHLDGHNSGNILVGSILGNPGDFPALSRNTLQCLLDGNMLVVQENILQTTMIVQALAAILIAIFHCAILAQPIHGHGQLVHHDAINGPGFQHGHVLLDGVLHGQKQAQQQIIG